MSNASEYRTSLGVQLLHEAVAIGSATLDAVRYRSVGSADTARNTAFIIPAFVAPQFLYSRLRAFLENRNVQTVIADFGYSISAQWNRPFAVLQKNYRMFVREHGTPDVLISHSIGGFGALRLITKNPEIKKAILIAPPFHIPFPDRLLQWGARFVPATLDTRGLLKLYRNARTYSNRITLIFGEDDPICYPDTTKLPQASTYILERAGLWGAGRLLDLYHTHVGMTSSKRVHAILEAELKL